MPTVDADIHDSELDRIERWRAEALERAGYDRADARKIAERLDVDLHVAVGLVRRGCPHAVAVDILL